MNLSDLIGAQEKQNVVAFRTSLSVCQNALGHQVSFDAFELCLISLESDWHPRVSLASLFCPASHTCIVDTYPLFAVAPFGGLSAQACSTLLEVSASSEGKTTLFSRCFVRLFEIFFLAICAVVFYMRLLTDS